MEDPTTVTSEGVELRLGVTVDGAPLFGILDRLDRDADGSLTIVDYKTGGLPNRNYDSQTFANAELYAALCEAELGEKPTKIRLMYVAKGESIERNVSDVVVQRALADRGATRGRGSTASTTTVSSRRRRRCGPVASARSRTSVARAVSPFRSDRPLVWRTCNRSTSPLTTAALSRRTSTCTSSRRCAPGRTSRSTSSRGHSARAAASDGPDVWNDPAYDGDLLSLGGRGLGARPTERVLPRRARGPLSRPTRPRHPTRHAREISNVLAPLGVDMAKVAADVASRRPHDVIAASHKEFDRFEAFGVPTFVVNDDATFVRYMSEPSEDAAASVELITSLLYLDDESRRPERVQAHATAALRLHRLVRRSACRRCRRGRPRRRPSRPRTP